MNPHANRRIDKMSSMKLAEIRKGLQWAMDNEGRGLECDGLTRIMAYHMEKMGADYKVCFGLLSDATSNPIPHYWIEFGLYGTEYIVDFYAKAWLDEPETLEGVFEKDEAFIAGQSYDLRQELHWTNAELAFWREILIQVL